MSKYPNNPEQMTWITLAKNGNGAAFNHIVEKYKQPIYNLCYRMLGNGEDVEDAAQEIFIRAYFKLDTYSDTYKFSTWLFSIASHYCIDQLKKRHFQLFSWDDLDPWYPFPGQDAPQPEGTLLKAETDREARVLLNTLSPDYRTVVILKYWYTMSYEEMAQTLGTTVSAIKSRLFRAKKMMAAIMAAQTTAPPRQNAATVSSRMGFNSPRKMVQMEVMQ